MASPFHLFRKHQKKILVVVGVLCILVFTAGTALLTWSEQRRQASVAEDEVVVEYRGGKLTRSDLDNLRRSHSLAIYFLDEVVRRTLEEGGMPRSPGFQIFEDNNGQVQGWDLGFPKDASDEALVREFLLVLKAEEMGMTIPKELIKGAGPSPGFLDLLSDNELTQRDFAAILAETTGGQLKSPQLFDILRRKLLAQNMERMTRSTILDPTMQTSTGTPADVWEDFKRLNVNVQTELLPIEVEDFIDEVPEPTDEQVRALYEEHKDDFPSPYSPEPGFQRPYRVQYAYVKAELEPFLEKAKKQVTEEQIAQYYEEHKEQYKIPELPGSPDSPGISPEDSPIDPDAAPAGAEAAPKKDAAGEQPQDSPAAKPAEPVVKEVKEAQPRPTPEAKPAPEAKSAPEAKPSQEKKPSQDDQSAAPGVSETFFVNFDDPGGASDADEEESKEEQSKPTDEPKTDTPEDGDAKPAPKPEGATGDAKPAPKPEAANGDAKPAPKPEAAGGDAKPAPKEAPKPKYRPLEDVKDTIRTTIARDMAKEMRREALDRVKRQVEPYLKNYRKYLANKGTAAETAPPEDIGLESIAQEEGLTYNATPLISRQDFVDVDFGGLSEDEQYKELAQAADFNEQTFRQETFVSFEFENNVNLYVSRRLPERVVGSSAPPFLQSFKDEIDPHFLYWRTDDEEAHVPELEEVRDEVVRAWKMNKALDEAREKAEALVEKANAKMQPLEASLEDYKTQIVESNEFSWMSSGAAMGQMGVPQLSEVIGAEAAGQDFMKAVFNTEVGKATVAVNQPQTVVYVARVKSRSPGLSELREQFANSGATIYTRFLNVVEGRELYDAWFEDLEDQYDVVWRQDPRSEVL